MTSPGRAARLRARLAADDGAAIVEVVFLGVLTLLPLVYVVVALAQLQAGAYAAAASAREAGRLFVTAPDGASAHARAQAASQVAVSGYGVDVAPVSVACSASPCLSPEASVTTRSEVHVPIPLVPDVLGGVVPTRFTVTATHVEQVERFRPVRP